MDNMVMRVSYVGNYGDKTATRKPLQRCEPGLHLVRYDKDAAAHGAILQCSHAARRSAGLWKYYALCATGYGRRTVYRSSWSGDPVRVSVISILEQCKNIPH